ncbi:MAG: L,D-transpeptidase family protein [Candidatus Paceibacterota bacterium]
MYHKQLVNHVSTRQRAGMPDEAIQNELIMDGWTKDDIKEAFYYSSFPGKLGHFSFWRTLHSEVPMAVTIVFVILTVICIGGLSYFYGNKTLNYTINLPSNPPTQQSQFTFGEQPGLSNPDFFGKVKLQFINSKANFLEADLSAMKIRVYKSGNLYLEVPIITKGRPGSWWETPAGLYKISSKEKTHFSGMGHVWMPWSMNFQGNFYIHGRTYYPDGTLTSNAYTGGCIRLSTEDAERVFNAIDVGTPILVFEQKFSPDNFTYVDSIPTLSAPFYLSADLQNNHVFVSHNSTNTVPIASITKLITALVTTEYINLDSVATVPKSAVVYTSKPRLKPGQEYTIYQLLFPLLMESSNEAAETIARHYGRDNFIKRMNDKAVSIGMTHSHFADPSGASENNVGTAEDLFMLAKYIYNNRSFIFNITAGKLKDSAYGSSGFSDMSNFNDFTDNEYFLGGKNGKTTAAAESNLSVFEFPVGNTKRPVVTIVLRSQDGKTDSETLIDYTLNNFRQSK